MYEWNDDFDGPSGVLVQKSGEKVTECFEDALTTAGRCAVGFTGYGSAALSASSAIAGEFNVDVKDVDSSVVERGTHEFADENATPCRRGSWQWKRTTHQQVMTVSVTTRFATIQWYIGGTLIAPGSGTTQMSASCFWPFPPLDGRSQTKVIQVRYEVITEPYKSTLRLFNDPNDGCYLVPIGMIALDIDSGVQFSSYYTSWKFTGESCDFNRDQVSEWLQCITAQTLKKYRDLREKPQIGRPGRPGPVEIGFSEEVWRYVPEDRRGTADALLEIMRNTFRDDPETFTMARRQLETEIGLPGGISRLIEFRSAESTGYASLAKSPRNVQGRSVLAAGLVGILLVGLVAALKPKRSRTLK